MTKRRASSFSDSETSEYSNLPIAKLRIPDQHYMVEVMKKYGIEMPRDAGHSRGHIHDENINVSVTFSDMCSYEILLTKPNLSNAEPIPLDKAKSIAYEIIRRFDLDRNVSLVFDSILQASEGGQEGSYVSSGEIKAPQITQVTVLFRQVINGFRVLTPGKGELNISVDNDGSVIKISSSLRQVNEIVASPERTIIAPPEYYPKYLPEIPIRKSHEKRLDEETRKLLASWIFSGQAPVQFTIIPGSIEIGYDIQGDEAIPITRRAVEVDFGDGYHKRYWVTVTDLD